MSSTVLYMSVSLDGFVTGPNEGPDNSLGDDGDRLHEWVFPGAEGGDFEAEPWKVDFAKTTFPFTSSQYARFSQEVLRDAFKLVEVDSRWIVQ